MVISFDRICKVDYDKIIVVILVVYSLFNIYLSILNTLKQTFNIFIIFE